ncbi:hypothetical protein ACLMJK_006301 [Lecanora helva]
MARTYNASNPESIDAVAALNSLQSNFSVVDAIRKSGKGMNKDAIPEMIEWCRRIGYEPSDFIQLNTIHIAGTKGKGSTSAFISSILSQYLKPAPDQPHAPFSKIGLYTSPHLRFVRERIQINNQPLSEDVFAKYFFEVWDRLEESAKAKGEPTDKSAKPVYFRFLTLMAFHAYIKEGVDTAIIECGIGGEYDSTNILTKPSVTGITSLGIDHTAMLGDTIEEIAWHKGGIMKPNIPCYTAPQPPTAISVLEQRSTETSAPLKIISRYPSLQNISLGLAADFQQTNASLAIAIAWRHLFLIDYDPRYQLPAPFVRGLEQVRWPGRCEIRREEKIVWHIDGGHTLESIELTGSWFASQFPPPTSKRTSILLFNQQTRDANALARALHKTLASALKDEHPFTHVVFCTNTTFAKEGYRPDLVSMNTSKESVDALEVQRGLAGTWREIDEVEGEGKGAGEGEGESKGAKVEVKKSIEEAVGWCRDVARETGADDDVMVLVTGSLHLVGGVLEVLESGAEGVEKT